MYTQTVTVRPSDTSCTGEIKIRNLLNHLQDIAGVAVEEMEGQPGELMERGYAWVLLKYDFEVVKRLPRIDEAFEVRTWHTTGDGLRTLRAFELDTLPSGGRDGEALARAKTSWVLIDLAAQRPVRADRHLPEVFANSSLPVDPDFRTLPKLEEGTGAGERLFPVRFHDLDANIHVNNAVYFEWAYEATPIDLLAYTVRSISAEFRVSAKFGDTVRVAVRELPERTGEGGTRIREFTYAMWSTLEQETGADEKSGKKTKPKPLARFCCTWEGPGEGR